MACEKDSLTLSFKRGDTFTLDLTVTDEYSEEALALAEELEKLQLDYNTLVEENASQAEIDAAQLLVESKQNEYDAEIIVDITNWTITASIKAGGRKVDDLVVSFVDSASGSFNLFKDFSSTELWKTREHKVDIQFDRPSVGRVSSQTFYIDVEEDVT